MVVFPGAPGLDSFEGRTARRGPPQLLGSLHARLIQQGPRAVPALRLVARAVTQSVKSA